MNKNRPYQTEVLTELERAWGSSRVLLCVMPTGSGKTVLFCSKIRGFDGTSCVIVHRREILSQISMELATLGIKHRIIAPETTAGLVRTTHLRKLGRSYVDQNAHCAVISVQTLTSKGLKTSAVRFVERVRLAVFDEAHHYVMRGHWAKALQMFTRANILGVTATPERSDGQGLGIAAGGIIEKMIEGPSVQWLMTEGYLSTFTYKAPKTDLDVRKLKLTAKGDFDSRALREEVTRSHLVGDVVDHYLRFCPGKQALVFATDVETSKEIAQRFRKRNVKCAELNGKTDQKVRAALMLEFELKSIQVLVNVDLFDEGLDLPGIEVAILARPTASLGKYLQMCGRAFRPLYAEGHPVHSKSERLLAIKAGDKPKALIIDAVGNWERHGLPNWNRTWSLDDRGTKRLGGTVGLVICPKCTQPHEIYLENCPYCDFNRLLHRQGSRASVSQVDGDLIELDVEALSKLFARLKEANLTDDDYRKSQERRRIPAIGRPRDFRRYTEARDGRRLLKELIGWWFGLQPKERTLKEKHRRFYHRFGFDTISALTLKKPETDNLVQNIIDGFNEDICE